MARMLFRRGQRLAHAKEFAAVYNARIRKARGPLTVFTLPNNLASHRLGLSVGRAVGNAVRRNLVKRRLREAFRLGQGAFERGDDGFVDVVVNVKRHDDLTLDEYQRMLIELVNAGIGEWRRRVRKAQA